MKMKILKPRGVAPQTRRASRQRFSVAQRSSKPRLEPAPTLLRIKSILVPIDFSAPSRKALSYAVSFAQQFGAKLNLLHAVEPIGRAAFVTALPLAMDKDKTKILSKGRLEHMLKEEAVEPQLVGKILVDYGQAFQLIVDAARLLKTDLIIMSTHGYSGLQHVLLGSTTERVVRHAPCPVLVVRENEHEFI